MVHVKLTSFGLILQVFTKAFEALCSKICFDRDFLKEADLV